MRHLLPMLLLLLAQACRSETGSRCGAEDYAWLVGKPLAAVTLPADLDARVIVPDTMITMDIRPERLNIAVDGAGTIGRVYCG